MEQLTPKKSLLEKVTLRIFLCAMMLCAGAFLVLVWTGGPDKPDNYRDFSIVITLFVVGMANFLIWLPIVIYRLLDALRKNN
jgi:hypothetical protein